MGRQHADGMKLEGRRDGATRFQQRAGVKTGLMAAGGTLGYIRQNRQPQLALEHEASGPPPCCMARSDAPS